MKTCTFTKIYFTSVSLLICAPLFSQNWQQKGSVIQGIGDEDYMGYSTAMNEQGAILAIGAKVWQRALLASEWNGSNWVQKGDTISDTSPTFRRFSVKMCGLGNSFVFGEWELFI